MISQVEAFETIWNNWWHWSLMSLSFQAMSCSQAAGAQQDSEFATDFGSWTILVFVWHGCNHVKNNNNNSSSNSNSNSNNKQHKHNHKHNNHNYNNHNSHNIHNNDKNDKKNKKNKKNNKNNIKKKK